MIDTRTAYISIYDDVIIYVKVKDSMHVDMPDADENDAVIRELNPTGKLALLIQTQGIFTIAPEALKRGASEESSKMYSALAIVIDKSSPGLIGNYFIRVGKPVRPVKLFTDFEEAVQWLKEQYQLALES